MGQRQSTMSQPSPSSSLPQPSLPHPQQTTTTSHFNEPAILAKTTFVVPSVGAVVRARVPGHPKVTRRALVVHVHSAQQQQQQDCRPSQHVHEQQQQQKEQREEWKRRTKVDLLWDVDDPVAFTRRGMEKALGQYVLSRPFWITPQPEPLKDTREMMKLSSVDQDKDDDLEVTVSLADIMPLMDFETAPSAGFSTTANKNNPNVKTAENQHDDNDNNNTSITAAVLVWKERGDRLLAVGDAVSALAHYEQALWVAGSCNLSVGGSVVLQERTTGHVKIAEVDCISMDNADQDSSSKIVLDVVLLPTGEERTVPERDIVFCISSSDANATAEKIQEHLLLQERILCNMTRCFLQLAQVGRVVVVVAAATAATGSKSDVSSSTAKNQYAKAAILASTVAYTLAKQHGTSTMQNNTDRSSSLSNNSNNNNNKLAVTALLLRSQAYCMVHKLQHALQDVNRILTVYDANHKEAKLLQSNIQRQKKQEAKLDKKLVKDMCSWIQQQQPSTTDSETSTSTTTTKGSIFMRTGRP